MLLSNKAEQTPDIYSNVVESQRYYAKWKKQTQKTNAFWLYLYDILEKINYTYIKQISGFPGAGLGEGWWQSSIKEETFWSNENYLYFDVVVVIWLRTYFQTRQSGMMTLLHAIINHSIKSSFFFFNHCLLEVNWTGLGGHADVSWACSSSGWWARDQLTWTFFSFWKQQARLGMFTSWW